MGGLLRRGRRAGELSFPDAFGWRDAVRAQIELIRAAWDVRTRETGRLLSVTSSNPARGSVPVERADCGEYQVPPAEDAPSPDEAEEARDLVEARAVGESVRYVASRGVIRPECLVQALAVKRLLERRGLHDARIRVGVRGDSGDIQAHAWVEYRGRVVGSFRQPGGEYADFPDLEVDTAGESARPHERQ